MWKLPNNALGNLINYSMRYKKAAKSKSRKALSFYEAIFFKLRIDVILVYLIKNVWMSALVAQYFVIFLINNRRTADKRVTRVL